MATDILKYNDTYINAMKFCDMNGAFQALKDEQQDRWQVVVVGCDYSINRDVHIIDMCSMDNFIYDRHKEEYYLRPIKTAKFGARDCDYISNSVSDWLNKNFPDWIYYQYKSRYNDIKVPIINLILEKSIDNFLLPVGLSEDDIGHLYYTLADLRTGSVSALVI